MRNTTILRGAAQALGMELLQVDCRIELLTHNQLNDIINLLGEDADEAFIVEADGETYLVEADICDNKVEIFMSVC